MYIETINHGGKKFALLPIKDLKKLFADSEALADIHAYDAAKARIASDDDELIPFSLIERRVSGESAVKIWREYRGITQEKLASISGVSRTMIAAIEAKNKKGGIGTLKKLAHALNISLEQLV